MALQNLIASKAFRYLLASVTAVVLDFVLTLGLRSLLGCTLSAAAAVSFVTTGTIFYFVHEYWTFADGRSAFSRSRLFANLAVLAFAGAARIGVIGVLEYLRAPHGVWVELYWAAGVAASFTINFMLNRYAVFRR